MNDGIVVTALDARANFGKLLRRVEEEGRSLVIEKRGSPRAVLLSLRDYVRLAVPEPEVLQIIGQESKQRAQTGWVPSRSTGSSRLLAVSADDSLRLIDTNVVVSASLKAGLRERSSCSR
jgi:prevent-host-death family protein